MKQDGHNPRTPVQQKKSKEEHNFSKWKNMRRTLRICRRLERVKDKIRYDERGLGRDRKRVGSIKVKRKQSILQKYVEHSVRIEKQKEKEDGISDKKRLQARRGGEIKRQWKSAQSPAK